MTNPEAPKQELTDPQAGGWIARASQISANSSLEPNNFEALVRLSELLQRSKLLPDSLRGDMAGTMLVLAQASQLKIPWTVGLRELYVVKGRVSPSARLLRALVERHPDCALFDIVEADDTHATVLIQKRGWDKPRELKYTMEDARKTGLIQQNPNYVSRPREMMIARASGLAAQTYFPSVCLGLDVEDLPASPEIVTATLVPEEPKAGPPKTVLEKIVEKFTPPEPEPEPELILVVEPEPEPEPEPSEIIEPSKDEIGTRDANWVIDHATKQLGLLGAEFVRNIVPIERLPRITPDALDALVLAIDAEAQRRKPGRKSKPKEG